MYKRQLLPVPPQLIPPHEAQAALLSGLADLTDEENGSQAVDMTTLDENLDAHMRSAETLGADSELGSVAVLTADDHPADQVEGARMDEEDECDLSARGRTYGATVPRDLRARSRRIIVESSSSSDEEGFAETLARPPINLTMCWQDWAQTFERVDKEPKRANATPLITIGDFDLEEAASSAMGSSRQPSSAARSFLRKRMDANLEPPPGKVHDLCRKFEHVERLTHDSKHGWRFALSSLVTNIKRGVRIFEPVRRVNRQPQRTICAPGRIADLVHVSPLQMLSTESEEDKLLSLRQGPWRWPQPEESSHDGANKSIEALKEWRLGKCSPQTNAYEDKASLPEASVSDGQAPWICDGEERLAPPCYVDSGLRCSHGAALTLSLIHI